MILLFGIPRYQQVVEAFLAGIEARVIQAKPVKTVASVASFFVSRIDALVDPMLEKIIAQGGEDADSAKLEGPLDVRPIAEIGHQH